MEARTKIIAAVAVIMMCAAGLVGAGYAYTASTENSGNDATSEYVKLTQNGPGAYTFANDLTVYADSKNYNNAETFAYRLADVRTDLNVGGTHYAAVKLGETIYLDVTDVGRDSANLACTFATDGFNVQNTNYKFILKITSHTAEPTTVYSVVTGDDAWSTNAFTINWVTDEYKDLTVDVYYGYLITEATAIAGTDSGTVNGWVPNAPAENPLTNAVITFTATIDGSNNALVLDKSLIKVNTGAANQVITATIQGVTPGATNIVWASSTEGVATVVGSGDNFTTGTVSIAGAGTTTITATLTIGGVNYIAECVVEVTAPAP